MSPRFDVLRHGLAAAGLATLVLAADVQAQTASAVPATRVSRVSREPVRIAVLDSRLLFDSLPGRSAAESEFALEQAKARTLLNTATDSLRHALEEFVKAEPSLSPRQREAMAMHLRARELMVEEMAANLDHVIMRRQHEIQAPLRDKVRDAVRIVRLRLGYDLVLDRAHDDLIIDADERVDITADVLSELRKAARVARSR